METPTARRSHCSKGKKPSAPQLSFAASVFAVVAMRAGWLVLDGFGGLRTAHDDDNDAGGAPVRCAVER